MQRDVRHIFQPAGVSPASDAWVESISRNAWVPHASSCGALAVRPTNRSHARSTVQRVQSQPQESKIIDRTREVRSNEFNRSHRNGIQDYGDGLRSFFKSAAAVNTFVVIEKVTSHPTISSLVPQEEISTSIQRSGVFGTKKDMQQPLFSKLSAS